MFRPPAACVAAIILIVASAPGRGEDLPPLADAKVERAIGRLKSQLYAGQDRKEGLWQDNAGVSALAVHALLVSGESPQHPLLARAIAKLVKLKPARTYNVAVRAHVWSRLPGRYLPLLERDAMWLLSAHDGHARFRYTRRPANFDHSVTQYALLGLWESAKRGVEVPRSFWKQAEKHFIAAQNHDGGWGYHLQDGSTGSMTAAGLTVLLITQQQLDANRPTSPEPLRQAIGRGFAWLDDRFDGPRNMTATGSDAGHNYYYLYSIERAALASGVKFISGRDWFQVGARFVIEDVVEDEGGLGGRIGPGRVVDRAFALLFLARGRVPTWITKLALPGYQWNLRPNDINRLTAYLSNVREKEIRWQTVSLDQPAEAFANTPVAYLTGREAIKMTADQLSNLRRYLDRGGLLVLNPYNDSTRFARSANDLAAALYPHLSMRPLPPDHLIYNALHRVRADTRFRHQVVSNGARDLIILTGRDWGRSFRSRAVGGSRSWKMATNLFTIVTDRGHAPLHLAMPFESRGQRPVTGRVTIGRARYAQRADHGIVEPQAWPVFADYFFNRTGVELSTRDVDLASIGRVGLPLVHLAGVEPVKLSRSEHDAIKKYTDNGGTLLVESVGGHGEFAASIEVQLTQSLAIPLVTLNHNSPPLQGIAIRHRRYAIEKNDNMPARRMSAFMIGNRPAVIVCRHDLSLGLLGVRHWGVAGYQRQTARELIAALVEHVATPGATLRPDLSDQPEASAAPVGDSTPSEDEVALPVISK